MSNFERTTRILKSMKAAWGEGAECPPEFDCWEPEGNYVVSSWNDKLDFSTIEEDVDTIIIDACSGESHTWDDILGLLSSPARESITELNLGHDGLTEADDEKMETLLKGLPNLRKVHYCGYYSQYDLKSIVEREGMNIKCIAIE